MDGHRGWRFEYEPPVVRTGRGSVAALEAELAALGCERALVVTGRTVGETDAVRDPVVSGLGDRCVGVFAETTPAKRLSTALDAAARMRATDADVVVGLGGGSSLDVATVASVLAATAEPDRAVAAVGADGRLPVPDGPLPPVVAVPTTLAGADLSLAAGLSAEVDGAVVEGGVSDPRLTPALAVYDADLLATTPPDVLRSSAMNGFDKGVETLYAATAAPVTDATAAAGVETLVGALPTLGRDDRESWALEAVLDGLVLVQYGTSRPDAATLSAIHAFGHGLRIVADVHQGLAHGVVAPHVLEDLFAQVDGRRDRLAAALGVSTAGGPEAVADRVVDAVAAVRDSLGVPDRLRDLDGLDRSDLEDVALAVADDSLLENAPRGYELAPGRAAAVLAAAW